MRPTFSILCFTVLSGIGYGAWFLYGLFWASGLDCAGATDAAPPAACGEPFATTAGFVLAFVLVAAGLFASLGHLGKPLRAWRALTQWRSSWLSREGVAALLSFIPAALLLLSLLSSQRSEFAGLASMQRPLGLLLAAGALATVFCTANIYASLKTIRAWHDRHVTPAYLVLGLQGGALLAWACSTWSTPAASSGISPLAVLVLAGAGIGAWIKHRYWRSIDALPTVTTGYAIGLESLGNVRPLEAPHTEENYLTHEMGFVLARKHAAKLRRIALVAAFLVPALLAGLALAVPALNVPASGLALASGILGLFVERWLFFAEARHAVMAYYGR